MEKNEIRKTNQTDINNNDSFVMVNHEDSKKSDVVPNSDNNIMQTINSQCNFAIYSPL